MSFDTEVQKILRREGGYVNNPNDRGGETNFGISSKANPDVDVKNLTEEQAVELYRERYWLAANVDSFPEHMQGAVFDAAVQHGPETAKRLAQEAGGDMAAFNAGRMRIYQNLLKDPSQREFAKGWMNRLAEFGVETTDLSGADPWRSQGIARPVSQDEAWTTAGQTVRDRQDAARRSRGVRDPLGEAAVDYIASFRAAQGQEVGSVYDMFRDREAAAAEALVRANEDIDGYQSVSQDYYDQLAQRQAQLDEEQAPGTLRDQYSYLWREGSATGALVDHIEQIEMYDRTPDPGLKYVDHMHEWEKGRTPDEIAELRSIGRGRFNREMIEQTIAAQDRRREQAEVMRGASFARTMGLSLVAGTAGDPLGMLAGFGAYKGFAAAGIGARQALVAGNTGRAFLYGGAEAAVGNVAVTAAIDALGKQQSAGDYAMAAGFGFALGAPFVALDMRGANLERAKQEFDRLREVLTEPSAERVLRFNEAARTELGPDAPAEQVAARAQELELEEVRSHFDRIMADLPDEDRFTPRTVEGEEAPARASVEEGETADAALGDFYRRTENGRTWSESRELRQGIEEAELSGQAADAIRAVVRDTGASVPLRALASRLADLAERLDLQYIDNSTLTGQPAEWLGAYFRDGHQMSVRVARPDVIVHEALHGATSNLIAMPKARMTPELRAAVDRLDGLRFHANRYINGLDMDTLSPELKSLLRSRLGPTHSTQEFVTYAMTDRRFQEFLSQVPAPEGSPLSNAWEWFKELVADVLGLQPGERSALDEAIAATGDLLDIVEADPDAARGMIFNEMERVGEIAARQDAAVDTGPETVVQRHAPSALLKTKAEVDAVAKKYGLDVGISDPVERALAAEMYARAERILETHPIDEERLRPLLSAVGWEATSTRMLLSKNPLMRATAVMLMENPEGAAGRQVTASLLATVRQRVYRSAVEPEYDSLLNLYGASKGMGKLRTFLSSKLKKEFDREIAREMHSRWMNQGPTTDNQAVLRMADIFDKGYTMMGAEFQHVGAVGSARIPVGKSGFFPRVLRGDRVAALSGEERRIVTQLLSDEFQITAGMDRDFADQLAVKYLERGVDKATKGWMVTLDLRSPDTADVVRDAMTALGYGAEEMERVLGRFSRGGASFTKSRIDMDLNATHELSDGRTFRLGDLFEEDMLSLYKNYARRVSGEVALTQFGVMGSPGVKELRNAIAKASGEWKGDAKTFNAELESFDQFFSEMLGTPFGVRLGKIADNTRAIVSSAYLGGMGWTQLAESANGLHALGAAGVMRSIAGMPRLLGEVRKIARGEKVDNPILNSIEVFNGEIGSDQYRLVGLRDAGDRPEVYGSDELGVFSLAARGASHAVRVLSMQRAIEAVQVRGMTEQIVRKAMRYIREGGEDAALADMGLTPQLREAMVRNMDRIAKWQGRELVELDLTQMDDMLAARAFAALAERGASQIIQRTYPGEVGKWAHNDHLLLLTQFRTYPMVATQKQWRRVAFSQGTAKAVGYIIGSASIVAPIYLARTALQGVGKDDEWWERKLSPLELGRAMTRYTAGLGLTSDVIDAVAPVLGMDSYAGRTDMAGTVPAISYLNQVGRAAAEKDPALLYRSLPGNNIPGVQAGMQWLFSEE